MTGPSLPSKLPWHTKLRNLVALEKVTNKFRLIQGRKKKGNFKRVWNSVIIYLTEFPEYSLF